MDIRLLTLIENTAVSEKLFTEYGLSFYIEHKGKRILFDAGETGLYAKNAARMLISLEKLDAAVLSHNHITHGGGFDELLGFCPNIKIFARKAVLNGFYRRAGVFNIPIGIPREFFERRADNFVLFDKFQQIAHGVFLLSNEVYGELEHEAFDDKSLLIKQDGQDKARPDDFSHELFMVIFPTLKQEDGYVVVSSCSHSGVVNILNTARRTWENAPVLGFVGGIHLTSNKGKRLIRKNEDIERMAREIKEMDIGPIYVCHCTGQKGYERLKIELGDQIQYLRTGEELEF